MNSLTAEPYFRMQNNWLGLTGFSHPIVGVGSRFRIGYD